MQCDIRLIFISFAGLLLLRQTGAVKRRLHPSLAVCKRNDPQLSQCFAQNLLTIIQVAKLGYPPMNLGPLDPLVVQSIQMDFRQSGSVQLLADLTDVQVSGMSGMKLKRCVITPVPSGMDMLIDVTIPLLKLDANYRADGRFLLVTIDSHGNFTGEFGNVDFHSHWTTTKFTRKGKEHVRFDNEITSLSFTDIKMRFENLLGNRTDLNESINDSINQNVDVLYADVKPVILQTLQQITVNLVNNVYSVFPFDVLFPLDA